MTLKAGSLALALATGCTSAAPTPAPRTLVLDYGDFGPQAASYELIGYGWWQWDGHGDSDPSATYPIKVVVHDGVPLAELRARFPVDEARQQDYRYLERDVALEHLDGLIEADVAPSLTQAATRTRARIVEALGAGAR